MNKLFTLGLILISTLAGDMYAETYCIKNEAAFDLYVYNKDGQFMVKDKETKHFDKIQKDDFPLKLSSCKLPADDDCILNGGPVTKIIEKPDCYSISFFGGWSVTHEICGVCKDL